MSGESRDGGYLAGHFMPLPHETAFVQAILKSSVQGSNSTRRALTIDGPMTPEQGRLLHRLPVVIDGQVIGATRAFLRGDSFFKNPHASAAALSDLGVGVMLDLRTPGEHRSDREKLEVFRRFNIEVVHASMESDEAPVTNALLDANGWGKVGIYIYYVDSEAGRNGIRDGLTELAKALLDGHDVGWFCAHGKDRTGTFTAIALDIVGVPRETIAAEYRLTEVGSNIRPATMQELFEAVGAKGLRDQDYLVACAVVALARMDERKQATCLLRDRMDNRLNTSRLRGLYDANLVVPSTTAMPGREKIAESMLVSAVSKARWSDSIYLLNKGWDLFPSKPEFIDGLFEHIDSKYGSTLGYLETIGVEAWVVQAIREHAVQLFDAPVPYDLSEFFE